TVGGGSVTITGVLGVGNNGTLTSGAGTGHVNISGGSLSAQTIVLGSSAGGNGDMTLSGTGRVIVGGGFTLNDLNVNGGTLTVLDQAPPPGEDPVLDRSIVGGYLRDGALNITNGLGTSRKSQLVITAGQTGTHVHPEGTVGVGPLGV